jgi:hypothetical protein
MGFTTEAQRAQRRDFFVCREIPTNKKASTGKGKILLFEMLFIQSPSPDWIKNEFLCDLCASVVRKNN